ncbi:Voltage-gated hydrogen channel 1 [Schistosoma japonicum]|nr:Voltage-gated hydrogen channel 1 [Schistosoma japonicum]
MQIKMDDANKELINPTTKSLRKHQPIGKCTLARKRLKHVFNMRKYYLSIIGLTGMEVILVLCRIILEIESLRLPPGYAQRLIQKGQLALECLSLFTLLLFVIEVPFKIWAMGIHQWGRQLLFIIDSLVCIVSFSVDIYNIYRHAIRTSIVITSSKVLELCNYDHITTQADTASTFAEFSGLIIVYRLWYIRRYIKKTVLNKSKQTMKQVNDLQQAYNEADQRIKQLEIILQDKANSKDYQRSLSENKQNQPIQQTRPMSKVTYSNYPGQR